MDTSTLTDTAVPSGGHEMLGELRAVWPVAGYEPRRGYAEVSTTSLTLVDAVRLDAEHAVAVGSAPGHGIAARPLVRSAAG